MPDDNDEDLDANEHQDDQGGPGTYLSRKDIRALEKQGKVAAQLAETNATLERDLAFARAGIDTSTDDGAFFARGYAGELTPDAIRAQAVRFNLASPADAATLGTPDNPAPTAGDTTPIPLVPGEADLTDARRTLSQGAAGDAGITVDPYAEAQKIGADALESGAKFGEAMGAAMNYLVNAGAAGDKRVLIERHSVQALGDRG